jgi:hypothetical protein
MYTKIQQDMAWALFALAIKQGKQIEDMQARWDEMAKQSALKDKIIAELKAERKVMSNGIYVKQVNKNLFKEE